MFRRLLYKLNRNRKPHLCFIVGPPRSGTTWMWGLLTSHPGVASLVQEDFGGTSVIDGKRITSETAAFQMYDDNFIAKKVDEKMSGNPGRLILEKTPIHALFIDRIFGLFPDARIIFMDRDPRAVISSMLNSKFCYIAETEDEALKLFKVYYQARLEAMKYLRIGKLVFVKYEDLINDAKTVLTAVLDFLGLEFDDMLIEMLIAENHNRCKVDLPGVLRRGTVDSYKEDLPPSCIAMIENELGDEIASMGYKLGI